RRRRHHDRRSARNPSPGCRLGRLHRCRDRSARVARHQPCRDADRAPGGGGAPRAGARAAPGPKRRGPRGAAYRSALRRSAAARVRGPRPPSQALMRALAGVALGLWAAGQPLTGQEADWSTRPVRPTVGDTVWLERVFAAPPGWRVRPGRIDNDEHGEPLADATIERTNSGWLVR